MSEPTWTVRSETRQIDNESFWKVYRGDLMVATVWANKVLSGRYKAFYHEDPTKDFGVGIGLFDDLVQAVDAVKAVSEMIR